MRNLLFGLSLALAVAGWDVSSMGRLEDLSKPYLGVYECESMLLSGQDCSACLDYLRLELEDGGICTLSYRTETGREGSLTFPYTLDMGRSVFTIRYQNVARSYPYADGSILIDENFGGTLLHAEFRM